LCTPDGEQVIVGTRQGVAAVYNIATGQLVRRLDQVVSSVVGAKLVAHEQGPAAWIDQHAAIVGSMALRDSDDIVLVSSAGDVWIVNHQTGIIRKQLIHKGVQSTGSSSGGPLIAMADQDEVFVFDATHALRELSRQTRVFPAAAIHPSLSPDGKLVLFAMEDHDEPGTSVIVAHDVDAAAVRWTAKAQFPHFFGFSPDGSRVVALCDDIKVFDSQSGACLMQSPKLVFPGRNGQSAAWQSSMQSAVIDVANRYVAIDGDTLQVWEIAAARKVAESSRLGAKALQLSAEGDVLLGQVEDSVRSWRFSDLKEMKRLQGTSTGILMGSTRDNHIVERRGHQLIAQTWPTNHPICDFEHDGPTLCIDFHPTCRRIVTGGADGKLNVWQYPSGEKLLELPFSRTVAAVRFSIDGSRLIAIDRDGKVGIWDSKPPAANVQP
jgi:WD40 repeat protein